MEAYKSALIPNFLFVFGKFTGTAWLAEFTGDVAFFDTAAEIKMCIRDRELDASEFFFLNRYGERYSEQSARRMIQRYTQEAMIEIHITPQDVYKRQSLYLV